MQGFSANMQTAVVLALDSEDGENEINQLASQVLHLSCAPDLN
jgi:hypothetical protein